MGKQITIDERTLRLAAWGLICLLILGVAGAVAGYLLKNGPEAPKEATKVEFGTVVAREAEVTAVQLKLSSQGDVVPKRRTTITAEVGGKLEFIDPRLEAGEVFKDGETLLQIDRADYEAALATARATVAGANLALELEEARKIQALRDWAKLGNGAEASDLVKRIPQLASAQANIDAAKAAVEKAQRDLERTELTAPYDCRIERTFVDTGAVVRPGVPLVELVSRGAVEVRLPVSLEDYGFLQQVDGTPSGAVTATGTIGGQTKTWTGRIVRSEESVERETRSINVIVEFGGDDENAPPIGMFVKAEITGVSLDGVVAVPREAMLNRNEVLLATNGLLEFRAVEVLRTERDVVLVNKGIKGGEMIVLTPPNAPVPGNRVNLQDENGKMLPVTTEEAEAPEKQAVSE